MNNIEKLEKIRKYIKEDLYIPDKEKIKAVRLFIRTLRDAEMITKEETIQLIYYVNLIISKQIKGD